MIEWSETHIMLRDAVRSFCETDIEPHLDQLEHGYTPPYEVLRKFVKTFGIDEMARDNFHRALARNQSEDRPAADGAGAAPSTPEQLAQRIDADTIVFICKLDEPGVEPRQRKILSFVLDSPMEGLSQSAPFKKMGIHSSPTGELFLDDVKAGPERLLGESETVSARSGAKSTFSAERSGVVSMALGIVERCLELSVKYANERIQFGHQLHDIDLAEY